MTLGELRILLTGRLARFTTPSTDFSGYLDQELRAAQRRLEQLPGLPGFLKKRISDDLLDGTYDLPEDYLRLLEEEELPVRITVLGAKRKLTREDRSYAEERYSGVGTPYCFVQEGLTLYFFPEPMEEYTLELAYYAADTQLTDDAGNKWSRFASELLVAEAGFVLANNYLKNAEAAAMFNAERRVMRDALYGADTARDMAGRYSSED